MPLPFLKRWQSWFLPLCRQLGFLEVRTILHYRAYRWVTVLIIHYKNLSFPPFSAPRNRMFLLFSIKLIIYYSYLYISYIRSSHLYFTP